MKEKIDLFDDFELESLVYQPDPSTFFEYLETLRSDRYQEPERRLMLAVLEDGVSTFQENLFNGTPEGRTLFRDAEEWFLRNDDHFVFSMNVICQFVGLDSDCVRHGLMKWKRESLLQQSSFQAAVFSRFQAVRSVASQSGKTRKKDLRVFR